MSLCGWAVVLAGCGSSAEIRLHQPQLMGRQRELHLISEQVHWAAGEKVERMLAEFPLPGAATGKPMYLFYLRWPAGRRELTVSERQRPVRGFLIQDRGQYAGKAQVVSGKVTVSGRSRARHATRRLEVELTCEDGTRVVGRMRARRDDHQVRRFEIDRKPVDVEALLHPPAASDAEG